MLPSDFLGRPGRAVSAYDVTALSDLLLCCFRRKPFEDLLRSNPRISGRLLDMTLDDLDAARGCCCWAASRRAKRSPRSW